VRFLLILHSKYSAILSKVHSHRLLFRRFFPLGITKLIHDAYIVVVVGNH